MKLIVAVVDFKTSSRRSKAASRILIRSYFVANAATISSHRQTEYLAGLSKRKLEEKKKRTNERTNE